MVFGERYKGYMDALIESGMETDPDLVIRGHLNTKTGARVVKQILKMKSRPDGIFAGNDMSAVSLMIELKKAGVSIPQDIAIAGFNNIYISGVVQPALTTVNYPAVEMGRVAANILMEMLDTDQQVDPQSVILDHELVVRESSMRNS
jgi:LacI family transcriptional regulator